LPVAAVVGFVGPLGNLTSAAERHPRRAAGSN
jgi:hypothetical protein